eukprot:sb/3478927/
MSGLRLSAAVREVRLILCQRSATSSGVREFVASHYVPLKKENPSLPILVRECSDVKPVLYTRFSHGREKSQDLSNFTSSEILDALRTMDESLLQNSV